MPSFWRDPVRLTFVDADNKEIAALSRPEYIPRVGENVRVKGAPYLVERVGYDIADGAFAAVWVVCRPA